MMCILFIGRSNIDKNNTYKSFFDLKLPDLKIFTVNNNENELSDFCLDFNSKPEREHLIRTLLQMNMSVDLIIFDWSVFKFMNKLELLFEDCYNLLNNGGRLIFEYSVCGGGIGYDKINTYSITDMNNICLPYSWLQSQTNVPNEYNNSIMNAKDAIIQKSQHLILECLNSVFINKLNILCVNKPYPYINNLITTYYICYK